MGLYDAVYPLGDGSQLDNLELRFSLRSLMKHGQQVGKVFIIGEKPEWLKWSDRLIHIPFAESNGRYANTWEKALVAANRDDISERFVWMNDDFYILQDFNAGEIPFFCRKRDLEMYPFAQVDFDQITTGYQKTLRRTLDALKYRRLSTHHFGTHQPTNFEKIKLLAVWSVFDADIYQKHGLSLRTCYGNFHSVPRVQKATVLMSNAMPSTRGRFAIASHMSVTAQLLETELTKLYPDPSEFE